MGKIANVVHLKDGVFKIPLEMMQYMFDIEDIVMKPLLEMTKSEFENAIMVNAMCAGHKFTTKDGKTISILVDEKKP